MAKDEAEKRNTKAAREQYREKRRTTNKIICRKKREHQTSQLREIEEQGIKKEMRMFYQKISVQRQEYNANAIYCRDKAENLATNLEEIKKRWNILENILT